MRALQCKSQELPSRPLWSPRLGWYSRPGSNCISTNTWSVGSRVKSSGGFVTTYRFDEASTDELVSRNLLRWSRSNIWHLKNLNGGFIPVQSYAEHSVLAKGGNKEVAVFSAFTVLSQRAVVEGDLTHSTPIPLSQRFRSAEKAH